MYWCMYPMLTCTAVCVCVCGDRGVQQDHATWQGTVITLLDKKKKISSVGPHLKTDVSLALYNITE